MCLYVLLGQFGWHLQLLHGDLKHGFLSSYLCAGVVLRKIHLSSHLVARFRIIKSIFKIRKHLTGTKLDRNIRSGVPSKSCTVHGSGKIHGDHIPFLRPTAGYIL